MRGKGSKEMINSKKGEAWKVTYRSGVEDRPIAFMERLTGDSETSTCLISSPFLPLGQPPRPRFPLQQMLLP